MLMTALCRDFVRRGTGRLRLEDVGQAEAADAAHRQAANFQEAAARHRRNTVSLGPEIVNIAGVCLRVRSCSGVVDATFGQHGAAGEKDAVGCRDAVDSGVYPSRQFDER